MARGGYRPGAGRKPGSKNKFTLALKEDLIATAQNLGGVEAMTQWAKKNPTEFYKLYIRLLPQTLEADVKHDHQHAHIHQAVSQVDSRIREMLGGGEAGDSEETRTH